MNANKAQPALFLDRDGTIIEDTVYVRDPALVRLLPRAGEALRLMRAKGYKLFVISNQSGVGRGIISPDQFKSVHARFVELLTAERIVIDGFLYCFHRPDEKCACRKPLAGLIPKAHEGQPLDWERSFTVGDKDCDVLLAGPLGARAYLVLTGKGTNEVKALSESSCSVSYRVKADLFAVAEDLPDCSRSMS